MVMLERRAYPLLAVVLTAALVCVSLWRVNPSPQYVSASASTNDPTLLLLPLPLPPVYTLLNTSNTSLMSEPYDLASLDPSDLTDLIDLRHFSFLMNDPVCNASNPPLYVVIVHTAPLNVANRRAIRSTWGTTAHVVFLVGETNDSDGHAQEVLHHENQQFHDIVQGSFTDSYRNLTYKHVTGLKWVTYHCPGAKYVLKTDDDVFVNTPFLRDFLTKELSPLGARGLVLCDVIVHAMVKRSYRSKWRVSPREFSDRFYPDYCTGWAILYSPDAVFRLYKAAQHSEFFWIDDVHITGTLLKRINYSLTGSGPLALNEDKAMNMLEKSEPQDFLFSLLQPSYFFELWDLVTSGIPPRTR